MQCRTLFVVVSVCTLGFVIAPAVAETVVTFENGAEGWDGGSAAAIDPGFGNPAPSLHSFSTYNMISEIGTSTNAAFLGDYTQSTAVQLGLDVNTHSIIDTGVVLQIELRDDNNPPPGYIYVSVWYELGILDPTDVGWHTWSVTIADTSAAALPPGWHGTGASDPITFEQHLPANRTFASVLAGVDRVVLTNLINTAYLEASHDVSLDNLFIRQAGPGDVNFDGVVDIFDVNFVSAYWDGSGPDGDANGDGIVNIFDVNMISANWTISGGEATVVPEPTALGLASVAVSVLFLWWPGPRCANRSISPRRQRHLARRLISLYTVGNRAHSTAESSEFSRRA